jgi:hypothetical protein
MAQTDSERTEKKFKILNLLDYMDDKDLQEIATTLYNISKRRQEIKLKKEMIDG